MAPTQRFSHETALLAELNHRLFNTLQIIPELVARGRRDPDRTTTPDLLGELEERLRALGALHRLLAAKDINLSPEQAVRLPLLVVELVINVLKHEPHLEQDAVLQPRHGAVGALEARRMPAPR